MKRFGGRQREVEYDERKPYTHQAQGGTGEIKTTARVKCAPYVDFNCMLVESIICFAYLSPNFAPLPSNHSLYHLWQPSAQHTQPSLPLTSVVLKLW